ncbi:MAG: ferrous iron transport protein B [Polyangiales bacterium]|jgi:ferrous iron transport protein B
MTSVERAPVLVTGNPNAGKTTLFNRWAGTSARTGNYPGVTVDRRTAEIELAGTPVSLVDIPGTYSLSAHSPEEQIAVSSILRAPKNATAVIVLDATALGRGLYLATQVLESGVKAVVALNMMDEVRQRKIEIDVQGLSKALGVPVVPIVAATGEGLEELGRAVHEAKKSERTALDVGDERVHEALTKLEAMCSLHADFGGADRAHAWALWLLLCVADDDELELPASFREETLRLRDSLKDVDVEGSIVGARYADVDRLCTRFVKAPKGGVTWSDRIDRVLTHPIAGMIAFALVMLVVFEALFAWSDPLIGLVESGVAMLQDLARNVVPAGMFQDLLADGVVAGVGNVVVFVPQIGLLFLLIAVLEDSGYLARVAFVIDRLMGAVGLHGKAFVPLLSGFACAIPAVMATRTISDRKDRLVTMLALPLMSCSARLPVYVLITATVFSGEERIGGVLSIGAIVLFSMYALSVVATLGAAAIMRRTVLKGPRPTMVLELPPYRRPLVRNLFSATWRRVKSFLVDAGTIILALTIILWALLNFPKDEAVTVEANTARQELAALELPSDERGEREAAIDGAEAQAQLANSAGGHLGRFIEPAIEPLGMDWRVGIGVIGAFAAREVFVSTLGVVFGISEADEESQSLRESLREARRPDGSLVMTPLAGIALMVFFVLACQCMSTIAVVRRESGTWRWPLFMLAYMTALAYGASLLVFQVGSALGYGGG